MKRGKGGTKKPTAASTASRAPAPGASKGRAAAKAEAAAKASRRAAPAPASKATKAAPAKAASVKAAPAKPDAKAAAGKAPAPKPAPAKAVPAKSGVKAAPSKGGKPAAAAAKPQTAASSGAKAGKSAKPARAPVLLPPAPPAPKVEAPKKFQREYRKWLERLISLRHKLLQEGERLGEEGLKALEQEVSVDHMADYGSDSYEQDTTLALIENKSEAVRDVDAAIRRIETRSYGLCEECEQLIPVGRLEVLPHARYCVKCQAKREGVPT